MNRPREHKMVIARLIVSRWVDRGEAIRRIRRTISEAPKFEDKKKRSDWRFGDAEELAIDGKAVLFGRLGFERHEKKGVEYDEARKSYKHVKRDKGDTDYSNFIIIADEYLIGFEERPDIGIEQFAKIFAQMYQKVHRDLSKLQILPLIEKTSVRDQLRTYEKIVQVRMTVSRSNPDDRDDFQPLDTLLAIADSDSTTMDFRNKSAGLKIENSVIGQGIALSDHGYGYYMIKGIKDGIRTIIHSIEKIEKTDVEIGDDDDIVEIAHQFFRTMKDKLKR